MVSSTSPRSVVTSGWVGSTNLGDELIAKALIHRVRELGFEPVVPSTDPEGTRSVLNVASVGHRSWSDIARAARSSAGLVLGGGGLIQDSTSPLNLPYHLARPLAARFVGRRFVGVGLGVDYLKSRISRWLASRVLREALAIGVRDDYSRDALKSLGIDSVVGADLALGLPVPDTEVVDSAIVCLRSPVISGIRPVASRQVRHDDQWIRRAAAGLDRLAIETGLSIQFLPMQTDRDYATHRRVSKLMRTSSTHLTPTVDTVIGQLASAQVVIGMRYHSGVCALLGARPAVMLGYAPKVGALVRSVGEGFELLDAKTESFDDLVRATSRAIRSSGSVADAREFLRQRERRVTVETLGRLLHEDR